MLIAFRVKTNGTFISVNFSVNSAVLRFQSLRIFLLIFLILFLISCKKNYSFQILEKSGNALLFASYRHSLKLYAFHISDKIPVLIGETRTRSLHFTVTFISFHATNWKKCGYLHCFKLVDYSVPLLSFLPNKRRPGDSYASTNKRACLLISFVFCPFYR